jgi:class 3 adenylate cyclase
VSKEPESPAAAGDDTPRRRRKLSAIMMADVTGFSRLMGVDDEGTVTLIRDFHQRVQALVEQFEGRVVDTAGDSVFGEFDSVVNAVRSARRIQEELASANLGRPPQHRIEARIGVHLGDVIVEDYRVYGDGVNIAARLEPLADPGGICVSEAVYLQIRDKLDLPLEDAGIRELKNIQHPIRLYKIPPPIIVAPAGGAASPAPALPAAAQIRHSRSWREELTTPPTAILLAVGTFLFLSPMLLFSTAGTFSTAGAILIGLAFGQARDRLSGAHGSTLVGLGVGIGSGAIWTNWSGVTNTLFLLAGSVVAVVGVGLLRQRGTRDDTRAA